MTTEGVIRYAALSPDVVLDLEAVGDGASVLAIKRWCSTRAHRQAMTGAEYHEWSTQPVGLTFHTWSTTDVGCEVAGIARGSGDGPVRTLDGSVRASSHEVAQSLEAVPHLPETRRQR